MQPKKGVLRARGRVLYELEVVVAVASSEQSASITSIWVSRSLRHQHIGFTLVLEAMNMALLHGVKTIHLDDMSSGHRKPDNIYLKSGMLYDDPISGCEMTGNTLHCSHLLKHFLESSPCTFDFTSVQKVRTRTLAAHDPLMPRSFVYKHCGYEWPRDS